VPISITTESIAGGGCRAFVTGDRKAWDYGVSRAEAIGNLILSLAARDGSIKRATGPNGELVNIISLDFPVGIVPPKPAPTVPLHPGQPIRLARDPGITGRVLGLPRWINGLRFYDVQFDRFVQVPGSMGGYRMGETLPEHALINNIPLLPATISR
jgi:hypothetical protein